MKRTYIPPVMQSLEMQQQYLLAGSNGQQASGPSATFMSNPDIGDEEDYSSRKMTDFDEEE